MDEDDHHSMHVVEFVVAYSGAVLDQGHPPQQILAWCQVFNFFMLYLMMIHLSDIHIIIHVVIHSRSAKVSILGIPIICYSKSDKSEEECARSKSIINGKLNKMNNTGEEPPKCSNSFVQVERWASSTLLATRTYEAAIGSLGGADAIMPMRLRARNRFCRIQRVTKAGCDPVGSVLFNDSEVYFAVKIGDRMFTIVSMNDASVKDGSLT
ncbi:hypothetical protein VPH35_006982 [Triticum aestivum]